MRDRKVKDSKHFELVIKSKEESIEGINMLFDQGNVPEQNIEKTKTNMFIRKLEIFVAKYSAGEDLEELKNQFPSLLESMTNSWNKEAVLFKKGKKLTNKYWLNHYGYLVWVLSLAVLFREKSLWLKKIIKLVDELNVDDELLMKLISAIEGNERVPSSKTIYKPFSLIPISIDQDSVVEMRKYLTKWYKNTEKFTWHSYQDNWDNGRFYYYGIWSFESAALTCILNLNDSKYKDLDYYPSDLVTYYRESGVSQ